MLKPKVAIIGGTGIGTRLAEKGGTPLHIPTPYGQVRGILTPLPLPKEREGAGGWGSRPPKTPDQAENQTILVVQRHSAGHKTPPHAVNYRALAHGLRQIGVQAVLSTAASGSLRADWPVGTLVACTDFIDASARNLTLYDQSIHHQDFTTPFPLAPALLQAAADLAIFVESPGVYLNVNGPRYETPAEIQAFARWGADLVGMTAASEAVVLREAGLQTGLVGIVTNLASGLGQTELHHGEVADAMQSCGELVVDLLLHAAALIDASLDAQDA